MQLEQDWFTVQLIEEDTIVIRETKHWEETNCYLLLGEKYALLIDTGLGVGNIREVVEKLTSLPILVVTTHVHWDHIGGHKYFEKIGVFHTEKNWLTDRFPIPLQVVKANLMKGPCEFPKGFSVEEYQIYQGEPSFVLEEEQEIDLGGRKVKVIHTPGHSPGHVCFYDQEREAVYSGDLIYLGTLDMFYPTTDPVQFYESVQKIQKLAPKRIYPGHHSIDVPQGLIIEIASTMQELKNQGLLHQGAGMFRYKEFSLHL